MSGTDRNSKPPLIPELLDAAEDLPAPIDYAEAPQSNSGPVPKVNAGSGTAKAMPKWLNKAIGKSLFFFRSEIDFG